MAALSLDSAIDQIGLIDVDRFTILCVHVLINSTRPAISQKSLLLDPLQININGKLPTLLTNVWSAWPSFAVYLARLFHSPQSVNKYRDKWLINLAKHCSLLATVYNDNLYKQSAFCGFYAESSARLGAARKVRSSIHSGLSGDIRVISSYSLSVY